MIMRIYELELWSSFLNFMFVLIVDVVGVLYGWLVLGVDFELDVELDVNINVGLDVRLFFGLNFIIVFNLVYVLVCIF